MAATKGNQPPPVGDAQSVVQEQITRRGFAPCRSECHSAERDLLRATCSRRADNSHSYAIAH